MPPIDDPELAQLFRAESSERLQKLDDGLLQLESAPVNPGLIEELLREAHSLKGAARMLGLKQLQDVAHSMEDQFSAVRAGTLTLTPALIQPQLDKVDRMRQLASEALGDVPSSAETTADTVASAESTQPVEAPVPQAKPDVDVSTTPTTAGPETSATTISPRLDSALHIDTLRVDANRLDFLLSQTGELVVTRSHILRLQGELDSLVERVSRTNPSLEAMLADLELLAARFAEDSSRLGLVTGEIESGIRNLRLLPVSTLLDLFPRMVHDLSHEQGKQIDLKLVGGDIVVDKRIIEEMKAPLMHLLRNAVDHGIETPEARQAHGKLPTGLIEVRVGQSADRVTLTVTDDGQGLNDEAIREQAVKRKLYSADEAAKLDESQLHALVLQPGFSTSKMITEVSGRGVGLDVVRSTIERMHGALSIESHPGKGLVVNLGLPVSLISTRVLMLEEWGNVLAVPFDHVVNILQVKTADIRQIEDRPCIDVDGEVVYVGRLGLILGCAPSLRDRDNEAFCVLLRSGDLHYGVMVDALLGEQEIVLKSLPTPIRRARHISGVTVLDSGNVCPVLNVHDLGKSLMRGASGSTTPVVAVPGEQHRPVLLLAEDSITTRIQEKRILEAAGYEVVAAVDGLDAWSQLSQRNFDAVVSDIMMPNMNGLELTRRIRGDKKYASLPVILVTSLSSDDDRKKGLEAGADAYLAKPEFDQTVLLDCLKQLL